MLYEPNIWSVTDAPIRAHSADVELSPSVEVLTMQQKDSSTGDAMATRQKW
jgi:hypothetical protein